MSSPFDPLLADDSAQESPDGNLESAAESLLNTVSDIASSADVHQTEYTRQVLLSVSQLLRILAKNPSSEIPDLELGILDPPNGISPILVSGLI